MDCELGFISLAMKAGYLEVGEESVRTSIASGKAKLLLCAGDATDRTSRWLVRDSEKNNIAAVFLRQGKDTFGAAIGRPPTAVAAITNIGMAKSLLEKRRVGNGK